MTSSDPRTRFRNVLEGRECVHPASVFDPVSARIAESLGFEIGMLAGSVASGAVLGAPDVVVLTLTELAEQARRITRACDLPLLVDADHGYGNAINVMRTVQELESVGVAALTIEDACLPLPFGEEGETLIPIDEMQGKLRAAVAARRDRRLCIIGRTSGLRCGGLVEAQRRAQAYQQTGVDALFLTGARTRAEVLAMHRATHLPLLLGGEPTAELNDREFLGAHGVRIALQGHSPFFAAVQAVHDTLAALRQGAAVSDLTGRIAAPALQDAVLKQRDYAAWRIQYLR